MVQYGPMVHDAGTRAPSAITALGWMLTAAASDVKLLGFDSDFDS